MTRPTLDATLLGVALIVAAAVCGSCGAARHLDAGIGPAASKPCDPPSRPLVVPPATSVSTAPDVAANLLSLARGAVVRVWDARGVPTGTAFREVGGRLVTNRHVAGGRLSAELSTWDGTDLGATISHVSSVSDLASMTGPAGDGLALALSDPRPATPVWVAGYPGGGALQLIRGTVLDYTDGRGYGEAGRLVRSDVPLMHGSSGSPVMNSSGEVVGVAFGVESDNSEALIVPASTVRRFLSASQPSTAQRNCSSG